MQNERCPFFPSGHLGASGETLPTSATSCCLLPTIKSISLLSTVSSSRVTLMNCVWTFGAPPSNVKRHICPRRDYNQPDCIQSAELWCIEGSGWAKLVVTGTHPELELQQRRGHNAKAHQDHQVKDTVHPISKGACKGDVFCGDSITFSSPDCSSDLLL